MSLSRNKIKYIHSLKEKKFRDEFNTFVAESDKLVIELLSVFECQLLIATTEYISYLNTDKYKITEIIPASRADIERASFLRNPQNVLAVFKKPSYVLDSNVLHNQLILALDGIQDPGNMGTIIRLCDWYGIENIICSKDTVDVFNPKVVQATMGAISRVKVYYMNLAEWLSEQKNIPVYGAFLDGKNMYETELKKNGILVMGNEGNGIRPEIRTIITHKLLIPNYPPGRITSESLNVSLATAILCSEFRRRSM